MVFGDQYLKTKIYVTKKPSQFLKILRIIVLNHLKKNLSASACQQQ